MVSSHESGGQSSRRQGRPRQLGIAMGFLLVLVTGVLYTGYHMSSSYEIDLPQLTEMLAHVPKEEVQIDTDAAAKNVARDLQLLGITELTTGDGKDAEDKEEPQATEPTEDAGSLARGSGGTSNSTDAEKKDKKSKKDKKDKPRKEIVWTDIWEPSGATDRSDVCGGAPSNLWPWSPDRLPPLKVNSLNKDQPDHSKGATEEVQQKAEEGEEEGGEEEEEEGEEDGKEEEDPESERRRRRRQMLSYDLHDKFSNVEQLGCTRKSGRVPHENVNKGKPYGVKTSIAKHEKALVKCLRDIRQCEAPGVKEAAAKLRGVEMFRQIAAKDYPGELRRRFKSCAVVGNAGTILEQNYGPWINRHEVVVRMNLAAFKKHEAHVGNKTTHWVIGHHPSVELCCRNINAGKVTSKTARRSHIVLWFPAVQAEMTKACSKKYPENPVYHVGQKLVGGMVEAVMQLREDIRRLGFGKNMGNWYQLTSGAHGMFLFTKICDSISMYGFTTYKEARVDNYTGRIRRIHSGEVFHDWSMEKNMWRLLHAAGLVNICS